MKKREAACCPEDVPFDEYIRALIQQRDALRLESAGLHSMLERVQRERDEARSVAKAATEHLMLADQMVSEAINEAAGVIAGMPAGRPGDRVVAVVERLRRVESAEALLASALVDKARLLEALTACWDRLFNRCRDDGHVRPYERDALDLGRAALSAPDDGGAK